MKIKRIENTKRNFSWGLVEKIISLFFPFILRTLLIKVLGEEFLGLSSLFSSILQVLNMAELGFSSAIIFNMYKPIAENDTSTICALMRLYKKVYRVIGIIVLVIGLVLLPFLKYMIKGSIPDGYNLYVLYLIYLINTSVSYFLFAYKNCLLSAHHRNDIISKVHTVILLIQYGYQLIALLSFKNYYLYILILPVISMLNNIINAVIATKMFPKYRCKGVLSRNQISDIKYNVTGLTIGKICVISRNSLDSIFISAFISLSTVAIYGNYYYILTAITAFLSVITNAMSAGIGNSIAVERVEKNYHDFEVLNFLYAWISGWCTICLLCLYQPFMKIWMGDSLMFPFSTVILFCIYFYSLKLGDIRSIYSNAAGLFWKSRYYVITEVIANAILNYVFVKWWGVNGIILATNLTIFGINFLWGSKILFKYYFKNVEVKIFFLNHAKYAVITGLNCILSLFLCNTVKMEGIDGLFTKGLICTFVPNIVYLIVYYRSSLLKDSIVFVNKVISK